VGFFIAKLSLFPFLDQCESSNKACHTRIFRRENVGYLIEKLRKIPDKIIDFSGMTRHNSIFAETTNLGKQTHKIGKAENIN
jgi:hypothetical protein